MLDSLIFWIGMAGTVAFAVTAVLAVVPKGINVVAALVLGLITAIGGGTLRDTVLGVPVFWITNQVYAWVAIGASLATFAATNVFTRKEIYILMHYVDGLGAALFAIEATHRVWSRGIGLPLAPIILGVVTGIGGGLIRDVLAGRENLLMDRQIYAIPIMLGCTLYETLLWLFPDHPFEGMIVCVLGTFGLRAAAIFWDLSLPGWLNLKPGDKRVG